MGTSLDERIEHARRNMERLTEIRAQLPEDSPQREHLRYWIGCIELDIEELLQYETKNGG